MFFNFHVRVGQILGLKKRPHSGFWIELVFGELQVRFHSSSPLGVVLRKLKKKSHCFLATFCSQSFIAPVLRGKTYKG